MMFLRFSLFFVLATAAFGFVPPAPRAARPALPVCMAAKKSVLTEAANCLAGECSVENVNELLIQIRTQYKELQRLEQELVAANGGGGASSDGIKDLIRSVLRAMNVDPDDDNFPQLIKAAGFAGEKFSGSGKFDGVPVANYKKA